MKISNGQSLVEILVVIGLLSILLPALITGLVSSRGGEAQQKQRIDATAFLKEGADAVRNIKYIDWNSFACFVAGGTCNPSSLSVYLQYNSTSHQWELATGAVPTVNGFTRTILISNVNRDSSGNIAVSGNNDPSTKKVTITVAWSTPYNSSVISTFYLSRLDNLTDFDTTKDNNQFGGGNPQSTSVVNSLPNPTPTPNDAEVVLGGGGHGDWCNPQLDPNLKLDLTRQGNPAQIRAIEGHAYIGTGANNSGVTLDHITFSNPPYPTLPVATEQPGSYSTDKANGIFGDVNYGYAATDNSHREVDIFQLSNMSQLYSWVDIGVGNGNWKANSVFVDGSILYVTASQQPNTEKLFIYDISSINSGAASGVEKSNGGVNLAGKGVKVFVKNSGATKYAYVATGSTTTQLQMIDVTTLPLNNPTVYNISATDINNINVNQPAHDVFVTSGSSGSKAYLATNFASSSIPDFFVIDTASRNIVGRYNTYHPEAPYNDTASMNPNGVTVVSSNKIIIVGSGGKTYQVVDFSQGDNNLSRCGGLSTTYDILDVAGIVITGPPNTGDTWAYIITSDANAELRMIAGGPGEGAGAATTGTFTSRAFVPGGTNSTAFNKFVVNYSQLSGTTLTFKVFVGSDGVCNAPASAFVGPNLNGTPYPTPTGSSNPKNVTYTIPFGTSGSYTNPGFCFKYQANFDSAGDTSRTPVLYNVTLNYSP